MQLHVDDIIKALVIGQLDASGRDVGVADVGGSLDAFRQIQLSGPEYRSCMISTRRSQPSRLVRAAPVPLKKAGLKRRLTMS